MSEPDSWTPPPGWSDPRDDPALPWITHPTPDDLDALAPPDERLADEPATVQVEDHGQSVAEELRSLPPWPADDEPGRYGRVAPGVPGISLTDYSRNPQARGFGPPCSVPLAAVQLSQTRFLVHAAVAEEVALIMRANEAQGYVYRKADTGSYNCRKISGTTVWSWHAWAVAVDANWQSNPYVSPLRTDRPQWERDRWNRYGWAGGWDYSGRKDAMHSEKMGTLGQVPATTQLARLELGGVVPGPTPPPAPPAPAPGVDEQVRTDQRNLLDTGFSPGAIDGLAGPAFRAAVSRFQFAARIAVDGICGEGTRAMLRRVPSWKGAPDVSGFGGYSALRWQQELREHGWRVAADGAWGAHSTSILRQFQQEKGIPADGRPGPVSWTTLHCTVN